MGIKEEIIDKYEKAERFIEEGKSLFAVQIYKKLIDEEKEVRGTTLRLAHLYEQMKLYPEVSSLLEHYLNADDDDEVRYLYGQFLIRISNYNKAIEVFEKTKTNKNYVDSLYFLGLAYSKSGNYKKAKANYIEYLNKNGERFFLNALTELVKTLLSLSEYDAAPEYLERLEKTGRAEEDLLYYLFAEAYSGIGMFYYAQDYILKSINKSKEIKPETLILAAKISMHIGEYSDAEKFLLELKNKNFETAGICGLLGFVYIAKKNYDKAKNSLKRGLELNPYEKNVILLKNKLIELLEEENRES